MATLMKSTKSKQAQSTMKDRLRRATGSGISMVPQDKVPAPPKKEEERVPLLKELIADRKDKNSMTLMVERYLAWSLQEKEAKKEKDVLSKAMKIIVGSYGISKVMVGVNTVNYFNAPRSSIKSELLLAQGVSPEIIERATESTPAWTLRVDPPKKEK